MSADALVAEPTRLPALLAERLGIDLPPAALAAPLERGLFATFAADDPLIGLVAAVSPEVVELLAALDGEADLPADGRWSVPARRACAPGSPRSPDAAAAAEPKLSVVIPCLDMGELLLEAVASVERTVPAPYELIIVDDGSQEERTVAILAALERERYAVVRQANGGLAAARNRGIAQSRGCYVLPLDADNRLLPGFAAAALHVLDGEPAVGVVYGGRQEFGARVRQVEVPELDLDSLLRANFIDACAVLRREIWEQCGGYDTAMPAMGWEDWDLWLGAAERGWGFRRLPGMTFEYRVRPRSMASRLHAAEVGVPLRLYMLDKHRELYRRRLPQLLTAQHLTAAVEAERARIAAERDRLDVERRALTVERDHLAAERDHLAAERERLRAELDDREAERVGLLAELADRRRHIEFVEGTRAWRLRDWILRLRGR